MTVAQPTYRKLLIRCFEERRTANEAYSLRAFARDLAVPVSKLSEIFSEKRGLSPELARKISKKLRLSDSEQKFFCLSVESLHAKSPSARIKAKQQIAQGFTPSAKRMLDPEVFAMISGWEHNAILELGALKNFVLTVPAAAKRLKIKTELARAAFTRLRSAALLEEQDEGRWRVSELHSEYPSGETSSAVRSYHSQMLKLGLDRLLNAPTDERDFRSLVLAFDESDLTSAVQDIRNFVQSFSEKYANPDGNKNRVYALNTQFLPLDFMERKK